MLETPFMHTSFLILFRNKVTNDFAQLRLLSTHGTQNGCTLIQNLSQFCEVAGPCVLFLYYGGLLVVISVLVSHEDVMHVASTFPGVAAYIWPV